MFLQFRVPKDQVWQPIQATALVTAFLNRFPKRGLKFWFEADDKHINWSIIFSGEESMEELKQLVKSYYPQAEVHQHGTTYSTYPFYQRIIWFHNSQEYYTPIRMAEEISLPDPLALLGQMFDMTEQGERLVFGVEVRMDDFQLSEEEIEAELTMSLREAGFEARQFRTRSREGFFGGLGRAIAEGKAEHERLNRERVPRYPPHEDRLFRAKLAQNLCEILIYVQITTKTAQRRNFLSNALPIVVQMSHPSFPNFSHYKVFDHQITSEEDFNSYYPMKLYRNYQETIAHDKWFGLIFLLTPQEIAALWHLPYKGFDANHIHWLKNDIKPIPEVIHNLQEGILIGKNRYGGQEYDVRFPNEDRTMHTVMIGRTGTGKTALMHRLIHADIAAGRGVCVIDPQGKLVPAILQASIPDHRIDDVIVLDFNNQVDGVYYPPPLNTLYKNEFGDVSFNIVALLRQISEDFDTTQMEYVLKLALRVLDSEKHPNLLDLQNVFDDPTYRQSLIRRSDQPLLQRDWDLYEKTRNKDIFPLLRRVKQSFLERNASLVISCHPDTLDIPQLVQQNKIILLNVGANGTRLDESARLTFGAAIMSRIEAAARQQIIKDESFMLYIDEAQEFINSH